MGFDNLSLNSELKADVFTELLNEATDAHAVTGFEYMTCYAKEVRLIVSMQQVTEH